VTCSGGGTVFPDEDILEDVARENGVDVVCKRIPIRDNAGW
jgi:hypothetical protein